MSVKRRRYPGDPRGGPPKPVPPRKPDKVDTYTVFWKNNEDRQKGTIWLCLSRELIGSVTFRKDVAGWRHSGRLPKE
jgi:hypothetical protein